MSFFRGPKSATTPDYTGLQLQTSTSTLPVAILWGQTKAAANVLWYANFQIHGGSGGKGGLFGGSPAGSKTYSADLILGLCEGPISGIGEIWRDQSTYTLAALALTLFDGSATQTAWGYLASAYPSQALNYENTAYVCAANYNLGASASIGNHNFEIIGILAGTGVNGVDADPALVIQDFLTNPRYGAGFASGSINTATLLGSSGDASLQSYCAAMGVAFSPLLNNQEQGSSILARWLQILNCAAVWSGAQLKFIPYGDTAIVAGTHVAKTLQVAIPVPVIPASGPTPPPEIVACPAALFVSDGGVSYAFSSAALSYVGTSAPGAGGQYGLSPAGTYLFHPSDEDKVVAIAYTYEIPCGYTPDLTPLYDLTDLDFVDDKGGKDPVQAARVDPFTLPTIQRVECLSRNNQYGMTPVEARDQSQIEAYGARVGSTIQAHEICDDANIGAVVAQTILQRQLYVRAHYTFKLSWEYGLLEAMDIVTISDANLGLAALPVRIVSIEEDDKGLLTVVAEELTASISTPALYPTAGAAKATPNQAVYAEPVNPPLIFEPPTALTNGAAELWLGASGGTSGVADPNWGGAYVWMSFDDATYSQIGIAPQPLRQGFSTAALAAASGWDTANTLSVGLAESGGALSGATATAAQSGGTLALIDGELLAYESATLTGANAYDLTGLERGLYGTAGAAHSSSAPFARLDGAVFKYPMPSSWVGRSIWLKFQSFNLWSGGVQDISTCTAYGYTVLGAGVYMPADVAGLGGGLTLDGATYTLAAQWTADPDAATYQAEYSTDGTTWTAIYSGSAASFAAKGFGYAPTIYLRVQGVNGAFSSPSWTQITISPGPQATVDVGNAGLYVGYDDLASPVLDALLQQIRGESDQIIASLGATIAQHAATTTTQASVNLVANTAASATSALASLVEQVSASAVTVSAGGEIDFVAQATPDGAFAAWELSLTATGQATSQASMTVIANSDGTSSIVMAAGSFAIGNTLTNTVPFAVNPDGSLQLQGVTKIASVVESLGTGANGKPFLTIGFGALPYFLFDDGT